MKAEIDKRGTLVITPETVTEAYAMVHWFELNMIRTNDMVRAEEWYLRGTAILVQAPTEKEIS